MDDNDKRAKYMVAIAALDDLQNGIVKSVAGVDGLHSTGFIIQRAQELESICVVRELLHWASQCK